MSGASEKSYTVRRGESSADSRGIKITDTARVIDLRQLLATFMKDDDYFMNQQGGRITDERKFLVPEIADKDGVIRIGPTPEPLKPSNIDLPQADVPPVPDMTWNLKPPGESPDLIDIPWTGSLPSGSLAAQEYYTTQPLAVKKRLFRKLGLDRGLIVRQSDAGDPFAQSSNSPAWYVPSDEGPAASTPPDSDTHGYWGAATRVTSEMRKRGINQAALNGSWSNATGLSGLALRSSYSRDSEEYAKEISVATYVIEERTVRKITLALSNRDLRPTPRFKDAVKAVVNSPRTRAEQYTRLHSEIFGIYGYFFPTEVVLGGKWLKEYRLQMKDTVHSSRLVQEITAGLSGKTTTEDGTFGGGLGYRHYDAGIESDQVVQQLKSQTASKTGGAAAAGIDKSDGEWVNTLAQMDNWAVIETNKMLPIISLLEGTQDTDDLRQQCISLINEFATNPISGSNTVVDMEFYVAYLHALEAERLSLV